MKKYILCAAVLIAAVCGVNAAPFQTSGMLRTPDAYVLPSKSADLTLVGYYRNASPGYEDNDRNGIIPYGLVTVGVLDRLELGLFGGDDVYFMNAKFKVIQETPTLPQLAIGMDNIFSPVNRGRSQDGPSDWEFADHPDKTDYEFYSPYAVASKQAVFGGIAWMFNLGVGSNRYTGQVSRSRKFNGFFTSTEISPLRNFALLGEYDGYNFNAGIKYTYDNFTIRLAGQALEDLAKKSEGSGLEENRRFALGISYYFDRYSSSKGSRRPDISRDPDLPAIQLGRYSEIIPDSEIRINTTPKKPGQIGTLNPLGGVDPTSYGPVGSGSYKELSPQVKELLKELEGLSTEREKAQKALEDLRLWIQELQEQNK